MLNGTVVHGFVLLGIVAVIVLVVVHAISEMLIYVPQLNDHGMPGHDH